ncbi:MAG: thiamine diphosphokinase [Oscillospiraceae bacterium]
MGKEKQKCLIISAGDMEEDIQKKITINPCDFVIACDDGYRHCVKFGFKPDILIGDFDSIKSQLPKDVETVKLNCEKDDTDTISAIKFALKKGFKSIVLTGALGGRIDHSFANIASLLFINSNGAYGEIIGDSERIFLIQNEEIVLQSEPNYTLSIFTPDEIAVGVCLKNVKYELDEYTMTNNFPIGISNEFTENDAIISVREGRLLVFLSQK